MMVLMSGRACLSQEARPLLPVTCNADPGLHAGGWKLGWRQIAADSER